VAAPARTHRGVAPRALERPSHAVPPKISRRIAKLLARRAHATDASTVDATRRSVQGRNPRAACAMRLASRSRAVEPLVLVAGWGGLPRLPRRPRAPPRRGSGPPPTPGRDTA